jgi:hypothetical protein
LKVGDGSKATIGVEADDFCECTAIVLERAELDDFYTLDVRAWRVALRG